MAKPFSALKSKMRPSARARAEARPQPMLPQLSLHELRRSLGLTQIQIAELMEMNQAALSKMENQADMRVATLFRLVRALGGRLKLVASFPGREVLINQFDLETK